MEFQFSADIPATPAKVWKVWSDLEAYPNWDPREEFLKLNTPFGDGATGSSKQRGNPESTFTISAVVPGTSWVTTCPLPGGRLRMTHILEPDGKGTRVTKQYSVTGPLVALFRLWYAPRMRTAMTETFAALSSRVTGA